MKKSGVSQATVAKHAGVSSMTVSRVLSTPEIVDADTRERVLASIVETGYVANKRTRTICVLISSIANNTFTETVSGVSEAASSAGYDIILGDIGYSKDQEVQVVSTMLSRRPDGIVISSTDHTRKTKTLLKNAGIPIVEIWDYPQRPVDMVAGYSNIEAGELAADYFYAKGYRRFAYFGNEFQRDRSRWEGFCERAKDLTGNSPQFIHALSSKNGTHSFKAGDEFFRHFKTMKKKPDAVFCSSDVLGAGIIFSAARQGIPMPDTVAVCGFGDSAFAEAIFPALTTIRVPAYDMGVQAGSMIIAENSGQRVIDKKVKLSLEIAERQST
ncbi:MAG: LacI family DNA-binding transcriptional regulator [Pseudomonadota bacterium]